MNLTRPLLVALSIGGAVAPPPAFAVPPATADAFSYVAAAKQASGGLAWDHIATLHVSGATRQGGQDGTFDSRTDLAQVRSVLRVTSGPVVTLQGWNGEAGWSADGSGQVQPGTGKESIAAGIGMAYRAAYAFFWPQRYPATFEYVDQAAGGGDDVIRVTPRGAAPFELWIDRHTHLITREVTPGGSLPSSVALGDYRSVGGVLLPFSMRESTGESDLDTVSRTVMAAAGAPLPATAFTSPAAPAEADPFPAGQDRVELPIRVIDNHLYVQAAINGGAPQPFIFDTGAIAILDTSHARAMGIEPEGAMPGAGFGTETLALNKAQVRSITIAGMTLPGQSVLTLDTTALRQISDVDFAGLLGVEVAQRAVLIIDYQRQWLTLVKPSSFRPSPSAIAVPLKFNEHIPVVDGILDGVAGEFEIDTGAGDSLSLMAPFAYAHQLVAQYHATRAAQSSGAGGAAGNLLARPGKLTIGAAVITGPVTSIATDTRGAAAMHWTAGNIGGGILRRFTVTLDYPHHMMYLEPNRQFAVADVYDRSGLRMRRDTDGSAVIGFVVPGGPAALAGIKKGDRILRVDGLDMHTLALPELRRRFKGAPGSDIDLVILSPGGTPHAVRVRLEELI